MRSSFYIQKKRFKNHGGPPPSFGQLLFSHHLFYITQIKNIEAKNL